MKLKINKACDLNSISVLPPHTRRSSLMAQPRSQPSQQSFSQGFSSQHNGMFSQFSQNSLDEGLTDNQRFGSQEKDNLVKRASCLAPISYPRDGRQVPTIRSSTNLTHQWSSAIVPDHKCQLSDELEHRIAKMETSLCRIGMVLDSVQADVMQVNKATKELSLEVEGLRQKSIVHDDTLHQLNRGQGDIRASLDVGFKLINDQLNKITQQDKSEKILSEIINLPEQIDTNIQTRYAELFECLSGDLQAISCSLNILNQKNIPLAILPPKVTGGDSSQQKSLLRREAEPRKVSKQSPLAPKIEMGGWTTIKTEQAALTNGSGISCETSKKQRASSMNRERRVVIELDEKSDEELSCFIVEKRLDSHLMDEVNEETANILRLARRRKRKQDIKRSMLTCRRK